jgi:hypothetical protein
LVINDGGANYDFRVEGDTNNNLLFVDASADRVGIGTSSPSVILEISDTSPQVQFTDTVNASAYSRILGTDSGSLFIDADEGDSGSNSIISFGVDNAERARIDSSGNLLVGTTNVAPNAGTGFKFVPGNLAQFSVVSNTASAGVTHLTLYNTNATNSGYRFYVLTNGGIYNFSGNNSNLSDFRSKTNIELSGSYLDKICAIPVKLFNYKDEPEEEQKTLGVIAQDVEAVAPELVNNEGFGETPEDGVPLKSVYTTDMMFALMKAIQELSAKNDALEARIAALEAVPGNE